MLKWLVHKHQSLLNKQNFCNKTNIWRIFVCLLELAVTLEAQHGTESVTAAGGNNTDYLDLAKKGGGHTGTVMISNYIELTELYDKYVTI